MALDDYEFLKKLKSLKFVDEIYLFGSRAREENSARADIDLALVCPQAGSHDWDQVLEIVDSADTLLKIDCIRYDSLSEESKLKKNIDKYKKIL